MKRVKHHLMLYSESPAELFDGGMGHRGNAELDSDDDEVQEDQDGE